MERIRMSGSDRFGELTLECTRCAKKLVDNGKPMLPIYYRDKRNEPYCTACVSSNITPYTFKGETCAAVSVLERLAASS